ncbi:hypothetical protein EGJ22_04025 [Pseudomonas sp. p99-361]|nr:hypothetical protein F1602_05805 [Pseudomonas putida]RRV22700.1 hypothetical protein EGJ22_04025 [Pseudomonas sp. p99-361]
MAWECSTFTLVGFGRSLLAIAAWLGALLGECHRPNVGAGMPANTGEAGASHRVGFFAGMPAPQEGRVAWKGCNGERGQ